jgi:hypothetical protein
MKCCIEARDDTNLEHSSISQSLNAAVYDTNLEHSSISQSLITIIWCFFTCLQKYVFERFVCNITNKAGKRVFFLSFKVGQSWYLEGEHRKKEQGNTIWYLGVDKITDLEKWS